MAAKITHTFVWECDDQGGSSGLQCDTVSDVMYGVLKGHGEVEFITDTIRTRTMTGSWLSTIQDEERLERYKRASLGQLG